MKQILSCACLVVIATAATVLFVVALPLAALAEQNLSLDGTWRFSFQGGEERDMPVPSCWELQGVGTLRFGEADAKESSRYASTFAIPSDWPADDHVILRFDGVMFGAHVTVNGKDAGSFRSSFNRNELDITALVRRDAEMKKLVPYLRRCNFKLQQGRPADGRTDTRILPDGTCIRFTEQSLFEVVFPGGRTETWNPDSCR